MAFPTRLAAPVTNAVVFSRFMPFHYLRFSAAGECLRNHSTTARMKTAMIEADRDLYQVLSDNRVRCNVCEVRCVLAEGDRGFCETRLNRSGTLFSLIYGTTSGVCADPIEKKPLYHFHPGSYVLSAGTRGCNFHCPGCQNWHISHDRPQEDAGNLSPFSPQDSVKAALENGCQGIAWTYNDPSIWFEHTYDTAVLAKRAGLYTAYVTNGYSTREALDKIAPYLDAFRVDVKAFSRKSYKKISGIGKWETIPKLAEHAKHTLGMHVEIVTNVTPTMNDDPAELRAMAEWIRDGLGVGTPWHVTRFHPCLDLAHLPPTPLETLEQSYATGKEAGLHYVYLGNVPGHLGQDTVCPGCGATVIHRHGFGIAGSGLVDGKCTVCQTAIEGVWGEAIHASSGQPDDGRNRRSEVV
jgi:pyruvate formate lyase activating enzyme